MNNYSPRLTVVGQQDENTSLSIIASFPGEYVIGPRQQKMMSVSIPHGKYRCFYVVDEPKDKFTVHATSRVLYVPKNTFFVDHIFKQYGPVTHVFAESIEQSWPIMLWIHGIHAFKHHLMGGKEI